MTTQSGLGDHGRRSVPARRSASPAKPELNPFPGLRPFGPEEAHLFFGREQHVEALLERLGAQRLSAVVGLSGSGKSSLVFAGVLPRLRRGYRPSGGAVVDKRSSWRIARMRPGDDPMGRLARALLEAGKDEEERDLERSGAAEDNDDDLAQALIEAQLGRSQRGLVDACLSLDLGPNENLLLIVDQFEELFRFRQLSRSSDQVSDPAAAFVQLLLRAAAQRVLPIYVILTMRSDFLGDCVQFTGLAEAINDGQFLVPLLNRDQREQAIRGPIAVAQGRIAPALVQRLLNDAGDMTDQLPVLQHALMRSFELYRSDPEAPELTLEHYERAGTMSGALSQHAEEALEQVEADLGGEGVRIVERLFRCLTERGAQGRGVRRPCRAGEVLAVADTDLETLNRVVRRLSGEQRGFLVLQPAGEPLSEASVIDISHEALMRLWPRLERWTTEEFAFANQLGYLNEARRKREQGLIGLWRDPELRLALEWIERARPTQAAAQRYGADLACIEAFLKDSVVAQKAAHEAELDARIVQRFRKLFKQARTSTLVALLAVPIFLILQGSGILDGMLPLDTRFKFLSVSARELGGGLALDDRLATVVIDDQSVAALRDQRRFGQRLGKMGPNWRVLQAELLTRLADAQARVVVFDTSFGARDDPSPLVEGGTRAFADAIERARRRGTAVVIAAGNESESGMLDTDPQIQRALDAVGPTGSADAPGYIASPCLGFANSGAAVFVTLVTTRPDRAPRPSLALAAASSLWNTPHIAVDAADRNLFLSGSGGQRELGFAGFGRRLTAPSGCGALIAGDVPGQQIVELSPAERTRGQAAVTPFEDAIATSGALDVAGKVVLVGAQMFADAPRSDGERIMVDGHEVIECASSPLSCNTTQRWGMGIHLDALNDLLQGRVARPIAPLYQLLLMLALCVVVTWHRLQSRDRAPWFRRGVLAGLIVVDLVVVVMAGVFFDVLMDEAYHVLAMIGTYLVVGYLDRRAAVPPALAQRSAT